MKFYDIGLNFENLIKDDICRIFPRVEIVKNDGTSYFINDGDIISLEITNYKEASGGYSNYGELVLDNRLNRYSADIHPELTAGCEIHIHYAIFQKNYKSRQILENIYRYHLLLN